MRAAARGRITAARRQPPAPPHPPEFCKSQESALALLWTVGIFALNCGPVVMGLVLDYLGPKLTALIGGQRWRQAPARSTRRGEPALPPPPATTHTHHHPTPPPHTQAWC